MLRLLADENFNGDVVRGLLLRQPDIEIVRVQDVGLAGADDSNILAWAAENDRIVLTHDRATLPDFAYEPVANGIPSAGQAILPSGLRVECGAATWRHQQLQLATEGVVTTVTTCQTRV